MLRQSVVLFSLCLLGASGSCQTLTAADIPPANKIFYTGTVEGLIQLGLDPCLTPPVEDRAHRYLQFCADVGYRKCGQMRHDTCFRIDHGSGKGARKGTEEFLCVESSAQTNGKLKVLWSMKNMPRMDTDSENSPCKGRELEMW